MVRLRAVRTWVLTIALATLGCERASTPPAALGPFLPVRRLVDMQPAHHDLPWGRYVKIAGEDRLALSSVATNLGDVVPAAPPLAGVPADEWSIVVPERLRSQAWLLRSAVDPSDRSVAVFDPKATGPLLHVRRPGADLATPFLVRMLPVPALESRDIETEPFTVPTGAVLAFGMGIEEPGWEIDAGPVAFRVSALDGEREIPLFERLLSPASEAMDRRWIDATADLAPVAGRQVRLRLSARIDHPAMRATSFPVWADPVVLAPRRAHMLNVLLVSLDTLRARSVSAYGAERPTTPNLDGLVGAVGTIFDEAWTTIPHTLPSHVSAFTSLYVRTHGIVGPLMRLPLSVRTLPEQLRSIGYDTGAITEDGFVVPSVGFERGFSTYRENTSVSWGAPDGFAEKTFGDGIDWMAVRRDRPFFLFLHTYEVHAPYAPKPPYEHALEEPHPEWREIQYDLLKYEQSARYLDDQIAALLRALDDLGLATSTLVVFMADHGEEFLEHGQKMHGYQLFEESTHIPLMMRCPGVVPAGRRIRTPVSLVDLAPTILDLVGAPPLVGAEGESLAPLLVAGATGLDRPAIFSEAFSQLGAGAIDMLAMRSGDVHCIFRTSAGKTECYDRLADPYERQPLDGSDPRLDGTRDQAVAYWSLRRPKSLAEPLPRSETIDPAEAERREKLRLLGYVP
jgi:arylsulfatase A-like enzyme